MKNLLIVGLLLVNLMAFGQTSEEDRELFRTEIQEKFQALELSDDQKVQFEEIQVKYFGQVEAIRASTDSRMSKMKSLKDIQKKKNAEVKEILTEAQYDSYLDIQKEVKKEMKSRYKARNE
ncbi:hypothetical protein [Neptunitalea lumnitzerae]|uniref:LTXXQ motif family protein n=1 Tax=Neptunitalea lumnitzerae TaxID=2965509 RepID=A0ABQ5MLJ6_9FLAO|nr:hypothetical protein [Neptunitalea sp. Y10]GLB50288.1 hypothetical protein Y10_26560 [Neptunitalea sp. Y10]